MKLRKIIWLVLGLVVVVAAVYLLKAGLSDAADLQYQFAELSKGDVENSVSATGSLSPVTTVEVGTQVSGTIDRVSVDFNDIVHQGQVLAVLDTSLLKLAVLEAQANVEKTEALLQEAQSNYNRNQRLFERGLISEADLLPFSVELKTQNASLTSAQAAFSRAERNLEYAVITSPINGIVVSRDVEEGQTVAASLSTPTLFVIAQDLARMEILAEVDESDIGEIKEGQEVRFDVATYSDKEFSGTVKQVRLQPETVSNVVTYTVVIEASNEDGYLLPGMTATIEFITDRRTDVLLVPNKALRFQPDEKQMMAAMEKMRSERQAQRQTDGNQPPSERPADSSGAGGGGQAMGPGQGMGGAQGSPPNDIGSVWYLDDSGNLRPAMLRTGLSNGTQTEVVASRDLTEGMKVIIGTGTGTTTSSSSSNDSQRRGPGFGGPPPGF
ncbi:MAG TPA: efflux RND transporter periplasmic adaptor subunit [candidate division Zixibacteria bacterium]|nr:efflux RND transporter periplasmic adaptor subunit [candidate division Zixibacteria bacterium]